MNTLQTRRRFLQLLGGLSLLSFIPGCKPGHPLRIATNKWPGYEPMYLAQNEGWVRQEEVMLVEMSSASDAIAAMQAGTMEGAALTLDEMLRLRMQGVAATAVLVFDVSLGADVVLAKTHMKNLVELKGKTIAAESGALGALMLTKLLNAAGLDQQQVKLVAVTVDKHKEAWANPAIDVLITFEPTATQLQAQGAQRIFDSRDIPGTIFDVLAIRPDIISKHNHGDALRKLLAGHFRAVAHLRHNPMDTAYRMSRHAGLSAADLLAAYRGIELPSLEANRRYLTATDDKVMKAAKELSGIMVRNGILQHEGNLAGLLSQAYLPEE